MIRRIYRKLYWAVRAYFALRRMRKRGLVAIYIDNLQRLSAGLPVGGWMQEA